MKKIFASIIIASAVVLCGHARAQFAGAVVDYTSGTLVNTDYTGRNYFNNPDAALGAPDGMVGASTGYPSVYSPFDPPFETTALTGIGAGGQLTLQLQNYVAVSPGAYEIGVWSNVGLDDVSPGYVGTAGDPVTTLSAPGSAVVSVSANGTSWVTLNGGNPITFGLPGNYYLNAGPYDSAPPASPELANFGQPFTGTLSDFAGEDYSQVINTLNGSAGGTWLNLDSTGLSQVGYIRFNGVASGDELDLSTVGINSGLAAGPVAVPEPATAGLLALGAGAIALVFKRRRPFSLPARA